MKKQGKRGYFVIKSQGDAIYAGRYLHDIDSTQICIWVDDINQAGLFDCSNEVGSRVFEETKKLLIKLQITFWIKYVYIEEKTIKQ